MKLKCKEGDMAVVIRDTPKCKDNIGRLVEVRGPVKMNTKIKRRCWLIRPLDSRPYAVEDLDGQFVMEIVDWLSRVEHPDAWLHPLRPGEATHALEVSADRARESPSLTGTRILDPH